MNILLLIICFFGLFKLIDYLQEEEELERYKIILSLPFLVCFGNYLSDLEISEVLIVFMLLIMTKDKIVDYFSTIFLFFNLNFENGDILKINDLDNLRFTDLGFLQTILTETDGSEVIIPNSKLLSSIITKN